MPDFDILPMNETLYGSVLAALNDSFGKTWDEEWLRWKHLHNPFGESLAWVAVDGDGLLGVRLLMRWELSWFGRSVRAVRPVDTATVDRARRRGVFKHLTEFSLREVRKDPLVELAFSTPNAMGLPGYVRMGWTVLPPIAHGWWPVLPGRSARTDDSDAVLDAFAAPTLPFDRLHTHVNPAYVRWRYAASSGQRYRWARLHQADAQNAIVYRVVTHRGVRILAIQELIGEAGDRSVLARSVAHKEGAQVVLAATGPGAHDFLPGLRLRRGRSDLAVRALHSAEYDPMQVANWALTLGDLERIM